MPDEKTPHSMSPSMRFQPDLPPGRLEKSIAAGYWGDTLFAERFESAAIAALDRVAVVSENSETLAVTTLSYRHLFRRQAVFSSVSDEETWLPCSCRTGGTTP